MAPADFRARRTIALVGLMGAGKSTVGARLAAGLDLPFADSDAEIARAAQLGVGELFERHGEPAFRRLERETIAALLAGPVCVLAGGGGAFADDGLRALMLERTTVIWLDAPVPTLARRLVGDRDRPLLRGGNIEEKLAELAQRRNLFYAEAHLRIDAAAPVDEVVERILAALG